MKIEKRYDGVFGIACHIDDLFKHISLFTPDTYRIGLPIPWQCQVIEVATGKKVNEISKPLETPFGPLFRSKGAHPAFQEVRAHPNC